MASSLDVARGVPWHCAESQAKIELIGHSRAGAFKRRLRVESNDTRYELLRCKYAKPGDFQENLAVVRH